MSHSFHGRENHEFLCDTPDCEESFGGEGTFKEVWAEAKKEGWRTRRDDTDTWCHYCPGCSEVEGF